MANPKKNSENLLAGAQSPYLLQHANNPVHWVPWDEKHLNVAASNDELVIISIGYAACHWCHVMEHESFEDQEVAKFMNAHFVNIKVDREERPDVDHLYMQALQLLTGQGGWPLNIVALPDGRPIWGGTYFPKADWLAYLKQLVELKEDNIEKLIEYANQLEKGIKAIELEKSKLGTDAATHDELNDALKKIQLNFDTVNGGMKGAPKFMMPTLVELFLAQKQTNHQAHLSLKKMALGGIFDVIGGGFSRYSVDQRWHIPHFEKMGYDNGQLLRLYAIAYQETQSELYREVIVKIIGFLQRELKDPSGGYYASLDADSLTADESLKEGAYYAWTTAEIQQLPLSHNPLFLQYFGIDENGYWEDDLYVPYRSASRDEFIAKNRLDASYNQLINDWEERLLNVRNKRPRPRLDNKIICGWNALIGRGLIQIARVLEADDHNNSALEHLSFMQETFLYPQGLFRINRKEIKISGFLDDYAAMIAYLIDAYETFFYPDLLMQTERLISHCFDHFLDDVSPLFFFSESNDLMVQTREVNDNVIASSNAMMAENLLRAGRHFLNHKWISHASQMLCTIKEDMLQYPRAHSTWLRIHFDQIQTQREIVVVGSKAMEWVKVLQKKCRDNVLWAASVDNSALPLFAHRYQSNKTLIYSCEKGQCHQPFSSLDEAITALDLG